MPYVHHPAKPRGEALAVIAQSLPMAAMFMRNRMLSWTAVLLAVQAWLNEPRHKVESNDSKQQPAILRVTFAIMSLLMCYAELVFPSMLTMARQEQMMKKAAERAAERAAELAALSASTVAETVVSSVSLAVETATQKGWWPL